MLKSFRQSQIKAILLLGFLTAGFGSLAADKDTTHATHEAHDGATAHEAHHDEAEDFDVTGVIMHHIADSHEWHFFDYVNAEGEEVHGTLPLPVILWNDGKLDIFSSAKFHNPEHKYGEYIMYHDKIYLANENGELDFDEAHHPTNATPLDISLTKNVLNMLLAFFICLFVFIKVGRFYKKHGAVAPKGLAKFVEPLVVFVRDEIALVNIGEKHHRKFVPYLLSLFFFIWINNMLGLFPGGANVSGNIAVTMVLAVLTLIITNINGNKHYWGHIFWMPGVPTPVKLILAPIELVGIVTKPFALMVRLFANMTAGHTIILSLISLIFIFKSIWMAPASVALTLFIYVIKVLVALLQAYIFALLTALFIGQAVDEGHH